MRYALLIGRQHGQNAFEAIGSCGDPKAIGEAFKALLSQPGNLAELHLLVSDVGVAKRRRFGVQNSPIVESSSPSQETSSTPQAESAGGSESSEPPVEAAGGPELLGDSLAEADEPEPAPGKGSPKKSNR